MTSGRTFLNEIPVLVFHKVDRRFEWGLTRITPERFKNVLEYLKENGYQTLTLSEIADPSREIHEKSVAVTFDDSYASIFKHAFPLLQKYGFRATVFVITGFAGQMNEWDVNLGGLKFLHLSWEQIRIMAEAGFEIGSHTVHHADLTRISMENLKREVTESKKHIEDKISRKIRFISFPFGRYNDSVIETCKTAGYEHGCGFWIRKESDWPFVFERKAYYLFDSEWNLRTKLDHHWGGRFENLKLRVINFCSHGTSLIKPPKFERYKN
jgi:peptidoglycan/xylan/chitin deacetylase (PgdA/CDA1 family)